MSPQTKERFGELARQYQLTESALLQRLIDTALVQAPAFSGKLGAEPMTPASRGARLYVRLRLDDYLLLRERAEGRGLAAATYASMLIRTHLRGVKPLPDRELDELKRAVAVAGMIGRSLNQLVQVAAQGDRVIGPSAANLLSILRACEALRDHFKGLLKANLESWEAG